MPAAKARLKFSIETLIQRGRLNFCFYFFYLKIKASSLHEEIKMQKKAAIQTLVFPMPIGLELLCSVTSYCHRAYCYSSNCYGYYYRSSYRSLFGNHTDTIS